MRLIASAVMLLCLAGIAPAWGQGANGFNPKPDPPRPVYLTDQNGNPASQSGGASTTTGSTEQDVRTTGPLNAAAANAAITTAINGQATVGYAFTGLTASGATLTYEQSIDGGTTWTGINAINRGTGVPEATRTTDGQIALSATGRTNVRVRVSTPGTGTITVATNVSVREGIFSIGSPLPPGSNAMGSVLADLRIAGAPNASGNPIFAQMTNPSPTGSVTGPGTAGSQAQAVQGIPNGVPQNVYPCQYNATLPTLTTGQTAHTSCDLNGRMIVSFPASSQTIGSVFLVTSSAVGAGIVPQTTTGSSVVAKASPGNLYGYHATFGGAAGFVAILNATAVPTAGAAIAPLECTPIAANASYRTRQDFGDRYTAGIVLIATSSCTTFTAVTPLLMAAFAN
ncbi:MAG: hypothetical protein WAP03_18670 [Methylorubrum rhodinum]|uniref:hypothetical protein n=1 Tax=Methylorubrum rhodinum TaxID=29428 RepID=UPI003BB1C3AB